MKKYRVMLVQKTYYCLEVEAENNWHAIDKAYEVDTTKVEPIDYEADVEDVTEVGE